MTTLSCQPVRDGLGSFIADLYGIQDLTGSFEEHRLVSGLGSSESYTRLLPSAQVVSVALLFVDGPVAYCCNSYKKSKARLLPNHSVGLQSLL